MYSSIKETVSLYYFLSISLNSITESFVYFGSGAYDGMQIEYKSLK